MQWLCGLPCCKPKGFDCELELTVGVALRGVTVGMGCWGHCNFAVSSEQCLCAISSCQSQALSFSIRASILTHWHSTFPLPTFPCSADTSFNSSSSFALPSSPLLLPVPSFLTSWGLTPISLLIPSHTHFFVSWNVGPALLFSCSCLAGEGSLSRNVPRAQTAWKMWQMAAGERGQIRLKDEDE